MTDSRLERRGLLRAKWDSLPQAARTPTQLAGRGGVSCGATHGVLERCNFACTSCYLTEVANKTPPLPFEQVAAQLDHLRAELGPGGKAQLTAGEVTLLPVTDLGRIVEHAVRIGLDPMLMTNGARILKEPEYLERLVAVHGLRKLSFHVDTTQRGRRGLRDGDNERSQHAVRDACADLVRSVRAKTGAPVHAAMTVTVTHDNLGGVRDVVDWTLANCDAIRLLSLLPSAVVGRTTDKAGAVPTMDALFAHVEQAAGRSIERHAMHFGHPECNVTVPLIVLGNSRRRRVVQLVPDPEGFEARTFGRALEALGGEIDLGARPLANLGRGLAALARRPTLAPALAWMGVRIAWRERRQTLPMLGDLLRLRGLSVRPLLAVVHRFMDAEELSTPLGQERLDACVFKLSVDGELISMCELNASDRRLELNLRELERAHARATAS